MNARVVALPPGNANPDPHSGTLYSHIGGWRHSTTAASSIGIYDSTGLYYFTAPLEEKLVTHLLAGLTQYKARH